MKFPAAEQKLLLDLQAHDNRIAQLAHSVKTLPERAEYAALEPAISSVKEKLASLNGLLEDATLEQSRLESDIAVVTTRRDRDRALLESSSSAKDVAAFESELASLATRQNALEEIELAVMERIESLDKELAATIEERDALTASAAEISERGKSKVAALNVELAASTKHREAAAGTVSPELLALYERQRSRYGIGAALLRRGVSEGSNMSLTESELNEVRKAAPDDIVFCQNSNAILVRTEESGL